MKRILALGLAFAAACSSTSEPRPPAASDLVPVVSVLDGDSIVVDVEGTETEVRLLGINAPERDECYDGEAKARTTELAGDGVRLAGEDNDRFGRLLRYAIDESGRVINEQLIAEGFALALTTDHDRLDEFKDAEAAAFAARIGRWQPDACGPTAEEQVAIAGLRADAEGDDARNQNGEWIDIENRGQATVSLAGWSVQDESSSHRFSFPAGFVLGPGDEVRLFSGCGEPRDDELYWCDGDPVWSNRGDTAYLLDPSGNVVDRRAF